MIRSGSHLNDGDTVYYLRSLEIIMGMSAYDKVHAPCRVQQGGKFLILLKTDMGQKHCHIHIR